MSRCLICHRSYFHRQKRARQSLRPTKRTHNRTTVYQTVTDHISTSTYQMATNLFSSSWFSGQLDIILLAHTLGTCDFFLPRVLPYRARSSSSPTALPPRDRPKRSRGKDKSFSFLSFFFLLHDREAPEKGILYLVFDYIGFVRKNTGDFGECVSCEHVWNDMRPIYSPLSKSSAFTKNYLGHSDVLVPWRKNRNSTCHRRSRDYLREKEKKKVDSPVRLI